MESYSFPPDFPWDSTNSLDRTGVWERIDPIFGHSNFGFKETELCFIRTAKNRIIYKRVGFDDCHTQMYV